MKSIKPITNRHDRVLIALLAAISLIAFVRILIAPAEPGWAEVRIDGVPAATLDLSIDTVQHFTTGTGSFSVEVRDGRVRMHHSSCPEQLCVDQGFVDDPSIPIVCIPNRTIIQVQGKEELDGVSK